MKFKHNSYTTPAVCEKLIEKKNFHSFIEFQFQLFDIYWPLLIVNCNGISANWAIGNLLNEQWVQQRQVGKEASINCKHSSLINYFRIKLSQNLFLSPSIEIEMHFIESGVLLSQNVNFI